MIFPLEDLYHGILYILRYDDTVEFELILIGKVLMSPCLLASVLVLHMTHPSPCILCLESFSHAFALTTICLYVVLLLRLSLVRLFCLLLPVFFGACVVKEFHLGGCRSLFLVRGMEGLCQAFVLCDEHCFWREEFKC